MMVATIIIIFSFQQYAYSTEVLPTGASWLSHRFIVNILLIIKSEVWKQ